MTSYITWDVFPKTGREKEMEPLVWTSNIRTTGCVYPVQLEVIQEEFHRGERHMRMPVLAKRQREGNTDSETQLN